MKRRASVSSKWIKNKSIFLFDIPYLYFSFSFCSKTIILILWAQTTQKRTYLINVVDIIFFGMLAKCYKIESKLFFIFFNFKNSMNNTLKEYIFSFFIEYIIFQYFDNIFLMYHCFIVFPRVSDYFIVILYYST